MAANIPCDLCGEEAAVVLMNNLIDGGTMTVGATCLPQFFSGALIGALGIESHAGAPTKCQTCRIIHAQMTTAVIPVGAPEDDSVPAVHDADTTDHQVARE
jgi:hypothetical protein